MLQSWAQTLALHLLFASEQPGLNATCEPGASIFEPSLSLLILKMEIVMGSTTTKCRVLNEPTSEKHLAPKPLNDSNLSL